MLFTDRSHAGRLLAGLLSQYAGREDVLILALPRGGVVVGYELARALGAPLDVYVVRKMGVPGQEELAMGAVTSDGVTVTNADVISQLGLSDGIIKAVAERELREAKRRELAYRGDRPPPEIQGKKVILVDDGLATGATMRAAVEAIRRRNPKAVIVAVPVAAPAAAELFENIADGFVCLATPTPFWAVGAFYEDFSQVTDHQVRGLSQAANSPKEARGS